MRMTDFLVFPLNPGTFCRVQDWFVAFGGVAVPQTFKSRWVVWGRENS